MTSCSLGPEGAPSVWALGEAGFLAPVPVDDATPTWSGPCWATIATGTGVAGHGITGNDLTGHRLAEHPDFVTLATRAGLPTLLAVSGWPPLALAEDGGPLFAEAGTREFTGVPQAGLAWDDAGAAGRETGLAAWDAADEAITARAAAILAGQAPRVSFVYLGAVDFAGAQRVEGERAGQDHAGAHRGAAHGVAEGVRPVGHHGGRDGRGQQERHEHEQQPDAARHVAGRVGEQHGEAGRQREAAGGMPAGKGLPDGLADGRLEHVNGKPDRDGHGQGRQHGAPPPADDRARQDQRERDDGHGDAHAGRRGQRRAGRHERRGRPAKRSGHQLH